MAKYTIVDKETCIACGAKAQLHRTFMITMMKASHLLPLMTTRVSLRFQMY